MLSYSWCHGKGARVYSWKRCENGPGFDSFSAQRQTSRKVIASRENGDLVGNGYERNSNATDRRHLRLQIVVF